MPSLVTRPWAQAPALAGLLFLSASGYPSWSQEARVVPAVPSAAAPSGPTGPPTSTTVPAAPTTAPAPPPLPPPGPALLQKALAPVAGAAAMASASDVLMRARQGGMTVTIPAHLQVIAKRPGRFRSEILIGGGGAEPGTRYVAVSDGQKVTTYQPGAGTYSTVSLAAWNSADEDMAGLGLFAGILYLKDLAALLANVPKQAGASVEDVVKAMGSKLTRTWETRDGANYAVFVINIPKVGAYRFLVDPQTESLAVLELTGTNAGVTFDMSEKILRFGASPPLSPATFRFSPPAGARRVKHLSIGNF